MHFGLLHKNNVVIPQGLEKAEEIIFGIGLGLPQDAIFESSFANLILGGLAGQGLQILDALI